MLEIDVCQIHNQAKLCFDDKSQQIMCLKCLITKNQIECLQNFFTLHFEHQVKLQEESINLLKLLGEGLEHYKSQILQTIDIFLMNLSKFIKIIEEQQIILYEQFQTQGQINKHGFSNLMKEGKYKLQNEMDNLTKMLDVENLSNILRSFNQKSDEQEVDLQNINFEQRNEENQTNQIFSQLNIVIEKKFDYQLMQQSSYKLTQLSFAVSFNRDASIMIVGQGKEINVFEFKQGKLSIVKQLNGHSNYVVCFSFSKKSNKFISACYDLIFWEQSIECSCFIYKILVLNLNEDVLISCSSDQTIKFWLRSKYIWNFQQQIQCSEQVYSVSLSKNEDKLIASIYDKQILVIQQSVKEWIIVQKISVEQYGFRLCFINQDQFVFQPQDRQFLQIFDFEEKEQLYKQGEQVKYQNKESDGCAQFPIQYIQQIGLILVKNDEYVHIIKRDQNGQYIVEQSIHFGTNQIFGCISNDGRYLATCDSNSYEIQIRSLME